MRIPDRYNDCGQDIGEPEVHWTTCNGCGEDNDNGLDYCDWCINDMLNDEDYLKFYAHEIEDNSGNLEEVKKWAKQNKDDFCECCKIFDLLFE